MMQAKRALASDLLFFLLKFKMNQNAGPIILYKSIRNSKAQMAKRAQITREPPATTKETRQ
jgi:hypothetical protein